VVDDGPGIPADQLSQVFQRHFVSDRVSGRRMGSGLGLAIVAELAAAMGAAVRAESPVAEGRGTRMVVWFPPRPSSARPPAPIAPLVELTEGAVGAQTSVPAREGDDHHG
jgi:signal transduction histidine kinase